MKRHALLFALSGALFGCASSFASETAPPAPAVALDAGTHRPSTKPSPAEVRKQAEEFGMVGLLDAHSPDAGTPSIQKSTRPRVDFGTQDVGDSFGPGGLGHLGSGAGPGEASSGIGLGGVGTIGRGSGPGNGQGSGTGSGLIGGKRTTAPGIVIGQITASPGLQPEVIQRLVRRNFERLRLCYEKGLRTHPGLGGKVRIQFSIGRNGSASQAVSGGSDLPDSDVLSCVVQAFSSLSFPKPTGDEPVSVTAHLLFSPGDDAADGGTPVASPSPTSSAPAERGVDLDDR